MLGAEGSSKGQPYVLKAELEKFIVEYFLEG